MSMSTPADILPGSRMPTSSTSGKLSVWSEARFSDVPPPPPPQAAAIERAPKSTALRERNLESRVIHPPLDTNCKEGARDLPPTFTSHRPLPGRPGRECAGDGTQPSSDGRRYPTIIFGL